MRLGILARADKTGLGYQTRAYYKHLKPARTMIIDISNFNGNQQYYGWYPDAVINKGFPDPHAMRTFLKSIDVLLTAETPYQYWVYDMARDLGVRTAVVINWEFFDHYDPKKPRPDLIISPSMWHYEELQNFCNANNIKCTYIHHPVDRQDFPRQTPSNKTFHIAGKPAAHDRNGTWDYLRAVPNGTITTQDERFAALVRTRYSRARAISNIADPRDIYGCGGILVLPRRYGGNCLPLNEALASGIPVIMPDISPNNHILPKEWLVPAYTRESFAPRFKIDLYSVDIEALAQKIDWMRSQPPQQLSDQASQIADTISWQALKPKFIEALEAL